MTASTLYEAVEPHIIWKQLLTAVFKEVAGDGSRFEVCSVYQHISPQCSQLHAGNSDG